MRESPVRPSGRLRAAVAAAALLIVGSAVAGAGSDVHPAEQSARAQDAVTATGQQGSIDARTTRATASVEPQAGTIVQEPAPAAPAPESDHAQVAPTSEAAGPRAKHGDERQTAGSLDAAGSDEVPPAQPSSHQPAADVDHATTVPALDDPAEVPATGSEAAGTEPPGTDLTVPAPGVVTGTLVRLWAEERVDPDHPEEHEHDESSAQQQAWLETPEGAYQVDMRDVADVVDGAVVTFDLGAADLGADALHPVREVLEVAPPERADGDVVFGAASTDSFGVAAAGLTHEVTIVLATPPGAARDATTTAGLAATIDGGVDTYWSQQSRGARGMQVIAQHGWQSLTTSCSDPFGVWNEVASRVGWTAGTRKHLVVYFPPAAGCGAGIGTVGSGPDGGGRSWTSYDETSIITHEIGHNMGLGHSNGLLCTSTSDGTYSAGWLSGCSEFEYRDYYDVMGVSWGNLGSLAAPHAEAVGMLTSTNKLTTSTPTRVHLDPMTGSGLRVLRINEPGTTYYVEYRVPTSWDAWLANNYRGLDAGVLVHRRSPGAPKEIVLLDGSVTSGTRSSDWRSALLPGTTLRTASGKTQVRVDSQDSSGVTLSIAVDGVWPETVTAPAGDRQVELRSPTTTSLSTGTTVFSGVATAPEGTLLWEVRSSSGTVQGSGFTSTGVNGTFDTFTVPVNLPVGTWTFEVSVPDESDGERPTASGPDPFSDSRTVLVR